MRRMAQRFEGHLAGDTPLDQLRAKIVEVLATMRAEDYRATMSARSKVDQRVSEIAASYGYVVVASGSEYRKEVWFEFRPMSRITMKFSLSD